MRFCRIRTNEQYLLFWLIIFIIFTFYIEICSFFVNTYKWLEPKCAISNNCTKILMVADPQIIGDYREIVHPITPFSIYDSDLYLKKTFEHAYNFAKPDIIVFLGDLMDEGSTANDREFHNYVRRIFSIFLDKSGPKVKHIWLPGDNDIGGEGIDRVTKEKLKRFQHAFSQPEMMAHNNLVFFKVNRLTESFPDFKGKREFSNTSRIFIGLSHVPLLFQPALFVDKVITKMLPHVLLTAHEHKSMIVRTDALLRQDHLSIPVTPDNNKIYEYTLGVSDIYEFLVPTCSYRMGTDNIGYGFAVIANNEIRYTVLWSPSRFRQFAGYLILFFSFIFMTLHRCYQKTTTKRLR